MWLEVKLYYFITSVLLYLHTLLFPDKVMGLKIHQPTKKHLLSVKIVMSVFSWLKRIIGIVSQPTSKSLFWKLPIAVPIHITSGFIQLRRKNKLILSLNAHIQTYQATFTEENCHTLLNTSRLLVASSSKTRILLWLSSWSSVLLKYSRASHATRMLVIKASPSLISLDILLLLRSIWDLPNPISFLFDLVSLEWTSPLFSS